jgi:purine-binding chemotaxis protein CheW
MSISGETDWEQVHARMEAVRSAIEAGFEPSEDQRRRILKTRARELAREPDSGPGETASLEIVEFELANEHYGLPLSSVRAVSLLREITPVPCTPPFVLGIINLRGEIRTVIDIRKFFALPEQGITDLNKIILVHHGEMQLGILADRICGVRAVAADDLQPSLPTLTGIRAAYLRGVTRERLIVLDAGKILSDDRILVNEEVESEG